MVRRSLVFKTTLYAALVFVLAVPPATFVARRIAEAGHREEVRAMVGPQLAFIKREVEARTRSGRPDPDQLEALSAAFHGRLAFVAWGQDAMPEALRTDPWVIAEPRGRGRGAHWIRLDQRGQPVGALRLEPWHPRRPHRWFGPWGAPPAAAGPGEAPGSLPPRRPHGPFAPQMVWLWVLLLMLAILPPLYLWVLRPLRRMVGVARRLADGDLQTPVPQVHADEFGELERAFEQLRVELRQALEARERLLTDVSHEIRGPLSRMMLALPLLDKAPPDGPIKMLLAAEVGAVDRLLGEVLSLARDGWTTTLQVEPVAIEALLRDLLAERALVLAQHGLEVVTSLEPTVASGDARLLARALGNVLDNAIKHGAGPLTVSCAPAGPEAVVRVTDAGPGVAPEHLPHLFEPFYRPDASRSRETGGTGLGLSIVRRIAQRHGGEVTLRCPPGGGTVVELRMPLSGLEPGPPHAAAAASTPS